MSILKFLCSLISEEVLVSNALFSKVGILGCLGVSFSKIRRKLFNELHLLKVLRE